MNFRFFAVFKGFCVFLEKSSSPSFSASKFPNILLINMLGFFIFIFVRLLYGQMLKVKKSEPKV